MKILIAEDDADSKVLLEAMLVGAGHEVVAADNGVDALVMATRAPPELIISDIMMPRMDGFDFCRLAKSDERLRYVPFIFYSATYTEPEHERFARSLGAAHFAQKPMEVDNLLALVESAGRASSSPQAVRLPDLSERELTNVHKAILSEKLEHTVMKLEALNAELRLSERRYQAFVANSNEGIFRVEFRHPIQVSAPVGEQIEAAFRDGYFAECNDAYARARGYRSGSEVVGLAYRTVCPATPERVDALRQFIESGRLTDSVETSAVDDAGSRRFLLSNTVDEVVDGQWIRFWGTTTDVTELRRATQEVARSERQFRDLIEGSIQGVLIHDGHVALFANQAAVEMFGYNSSEELLRLDSLDQLVHPHDRALNRSYARARYSGELAPTRYDVKGIKKDGSVIWLHVAARQVTWHGEPATQSVVLDVTAEVHANEERQRLAEQLHQTQKLQAVGSLAGGIAHDFNNLLTIVLGNLRLMADGLHENPRADVGELIDDAQTASQDGVDLVQRLLAFCRKAPMTPQLVSVGEVLLDAEPLWRRALPERIDVVVEQPTTALQLFVNRSEFEAVLLNLVVNARDAMPNGGSLRVRARKEDELPGKPPADAHVLITVIDTGTGTSDETIQRAFEPFFTTKSRERGTGLGLSMAYGFATQANGSIAASSKLNQGTTITLTLPLTGGGPHQPRVGHGEAELQSGTETILILEDNRGVRRFARECLRRCGYEVLEAVTAEDARELLSSTGGVDLLLADVNLPGATDGDALAREVKHRHPEINILLTTGDSLAALESQMPVLHKPYTAVTLSAEVRAALDT